MLTQNNRRISESGGLRLPGTVPLGQVSSVPLSRHSTNPSLNLVQIYDPHQHEPGLPSAVQKRRCRTIVAMALIIWGLFITIYIFITSPDDPVRCNEFNICNNHYLMFFVGPILLFTGCSMACYNFMTYGGCCHSLKTCGTDRYGMNEGGAHSNHDVTIFPNAIRNYVASSNANGGISNMLDGPPAYQSVVAEPWKFVDVASGMLNKAGNMVETFGTSIHNLYTTKELQINERPIPDNNALEGTDVMGEDMEPPPYHAIESNKAYARNSISTQTGHEDSNMELYAPPVIVKVPNSIQVDVNGTHLNLVNQPEPHLEIPITILLEQPEPFFIDLKKSDSGNSLDSSKTLDKEHENWQRQSHAIKLSQNDTL